MKWLVFLMILLLIFSCNNKENLDLEKISREIAKNEYDFVYKSATDSVKLWSSLDLESYDEDKNGFILDKIICFNSQVNKCVMSISQQNFEDESDTFITNTDYMQFFYGVKIKDTWYFFKGANIVLPREMYQKDVTKPLSFEKLHEIALKEVFSGYLKKRNPIPVLNILFPMYEVNEAWFDQKFKGVGWGCGTWIDEDGDGNSEWVDTCSEEEFNKMYYTKYHSVWELPADKSLFDMNIKKWTWITTDSFNRLFHAKKIDSFGYPYGTKYDREKNEITFPDGTRF